MTRHGNKSSVSKLYRSAAQGLVCASAGFMTALVLMYQGGDALGDGYLSHGARFIEHRAVASKTAALNRRIARERHAQASVASAPASGEPMFAHSEEEAKEKILAKLIEETGSAAPLSVDNFGTCADGLLPRERKELDAVLQTIPPVKYELSVSFNSQAYDGKKEEVAREVLGLKRYVEWHNSCEQNLQNLHEQVSYGDIESAITIVSAHLGLDKELKSKVRDLAIELYRARQALAPQSFVQLDEHGELAGSSVELDREAAIQAEADSAKLEKQYTLRFQELIGPERWRFYEQRYLDPETYGTSQLDWEVQHILFGSYPEFTSEDSDATPSASEIN